MQWRSEQVIIGCCDKMEKEEIRAVINFFLLKGLTATQTKTELDGVLGASSPSFKTVHMWVSEFKRGRTSCKDEPRSGRPVEVTTQSKVDQVRTLVLRDRRLKVRELAGEVGISTERVHHILHDCLGMTKLCARWVPRLLTADHKQQRALISAECLNIFLRNPSEFLRRL